MKLEAGMRLPRYAVTARNYGAAHANKIHSDEGAIEHGFAGALVPGVAMYAYLTRPVVDALGQDWLARGAMSAKLVHPIYDSEQAQAAAKVASADPLQFELQLFNSTGKTCATGEASMPQSLANVDAKDYPARPLPDEDGRWPATIAAIKTGDVFGSLEFTLDLRDGMEQFLADMADDSLLYRGGDAACHPAFWIAQANEIFMRNVALGMWIHTASEVQHHALAADGERLAMRGQVVDACEKRGHEIITADLAIFGEAERAIATIKHSAIIRLK